VAANSNAVCCLSTDIHQDTLTQSPTATPRNRESHGWCNTAGQARRGHGSQGGCIGPGGAWMMGGWSPAAARGKSRTSVLSRGHAAMREAAQIWLVCDGYVQVVWEGP